MLALLALFVSVAQAQTGLGTVKGTILDSTGAVVPGSQITLTNDATGVERRSQSSEVGVYEFPAVPIGNYTLTVEATGFKKFSGTFVLQAGQTVVIDSRMEVGAVDTLVEVTGVAPILTTVGTDVSDVKDAMRIQQLPLNGRDVRNLFNLTPGVEGGGVPRVNGLKVGSADMLLDGISLVDRFGGGLRAGVSPGLDTVQEYRIETTGSGAQYSRPATISLVTKSGTNEIHGGVFWTHRNNFGGLRARQRQDLFPPPGCEEAFCPPQYIRNEYGASAGGPVIKNKTFWFGSWEGQKLRQSRYAEAAMPTAAMWAGDFGQAVTGEGDPITIYDPYTSTAGGARTPFPLNQIPSSQITDFGKTMQSVTAEPTTDVNPFLGYNFTTYYPNTTDYYSYTVKGDHVFSDKDNISGRFTQSNFTNKLYGGRFGFPKPGSTDGPGTGRTIANIYSTFVRWNHIFSPTLLNEFQGSVNRAPKTSGTLADDTDWPAKLGLPNPFGATGWPSIYTSEYQFMYYGGWDADNRKDENLTAYQVENNVTWIKGKHSMRFGFRGRQEYNNIRELQQAHGSHSFYNDWTALYDAENDAPTSFTGLGFGSVLLGLPTYLSNQYNRGYFYFQQKELGLYFHDSFRVTPKLTLELGVRWDKWTVYKEKYNRLVNVDIYDFANKFEVITPQDTRMEDIPGIPSSVLESWSARGLSWKTANEAGIPSGLIPADNNNFGPRLGLAYRLADKWVLRGGYGEYFWTMPLSQILQTSRNNPPLNLRFENTVADKNGTIGWYALTHVPAPDDMTGGVEVPTEGVVAISPSARSMMPWDYRNWRDNRAQEWHFTIEHEVMKETAVRFSYIGNHGRDLEQRFAVNALESQWNYQARTGLAAPTSSTTQDQRRINKDWNFDAANHSGYSWSQSFQTEVERRYSNGLGFQWFYTFARVLTTSDAGGFTSGNGSINSTGGGAYQVPENIQILDAPNLSYSERLNLGYYNSANVPAHRMRWNGIYTLPFGRGKKYGTDVSRGWDAVIGGWELAFIGDWRSGNWLSVASSRYLFGDPTLSADERLLMTYGGRQQRLWFRGDMNPLLASDVDQGQRELERSQLLQRAGRLGSGYFRIQELHHHGARGAAVYRGLFQCP
jgi:hypothetical protein